MSLPNFSTQAELFSTAGLSASLFAETDRYRLFARLVYPRLTQARAALERCYCSENGRVALEPVLMLGTSILQFLDGIPDRQAVELVRYHAGWNFALNRQLGDEVFHPSSLVNFRNRLEEHRQSALGFTIILNALVEAGLVSRQSRQRLDSTQIFGRVARMSRLDCVRESLRLTLKELEGALTPETRPVFWLGLWERYVESQTDYRAGSETLGRKLVDSGSDVWQLLKWLREPAQAQWAAGPQAQLLTRVFAEQFEFQPSQTAPLLKEKTALQAEGPQGQAVTINATRLSKAEQPTAAAAVIHAPNVATLETGQPEGHQTQDPTAVSGTLVQPKNKQQLASDRVQNPHDPEATYSVKGQGEKKKEHVGYKVQVAETVCEAKLAPGEPTRNFIASLMTHPAYESDEAGALQMEAQQAALGLAKPSVQYVDGAYVSGQQLAAAAAEGRELIGPAPGAPNNNQGRFTTERFEVRVEQRVAVCPAGHQSTQCSRLEEAQSAKVNYRFEWSTRCAACPLRPQCVGPTQKHRTIVVGEHYSGLQTRRREQNTDAFKRRMKHRNAIEGTQSELVRGHGLRHARYRGLGKAKLQNYFIGAACNVKRWLRREAWKLRQAALVDAPQLASVTIS
jgi:transposase